MLTLSFSFLKILMGSRRTGFDEIGISKHVGVCLLDGRGFLFFLFFGGGGGRNYFTLLQKKKKRKENRARSSSIVQFFSSLSLAS